MTFAEKLDLLMKITNTTNSVLARSISLDASFISRLRRGVRTPAKNVTYLQPMVQYLARNCGAEYQKAALWEAITSSSNLHHSETEPIEVIIYKWLREKEETEHNSVDAFLDGVTRFQFRKTDPPAAFDIDKISCRALSEVEVFYGVEGKQNAVLTFLSLVLKSKSPQTLLLYSDEDLGWLSDSHEFKLKWGILLAQVISKGNRIKIIHTINRGFDEMLSGIKQWVPIYITGAIESYYYPKSRDGLFRRTLFIAPDTSVAVASSTVGSGTENAANFIFTNSDTVKALTEEYQNFLARCRPLIHTFTALNQEDYLALLAEFENESAHTIIKNDVLSNITMPSSLVNSIMARLETPDRKQLFAYQQKRMATFYNHLQNYHYQEIFPLPDAEQVLSGKMPVNFFDILSEKQLFYTPEEYCLHLQNIIDLLKTRENFHIYITGNNCHEGSMLCVREDVGVLVGKASLPAVIFAINESSMTAAFWDYMNVLLKKESQGKIDKGRTIARLQRHILSLTQKT